jgi:hypothetical protein
MPRTIALAQCPSVIHPRLRCPTSLLAARTNECALPAVTCAGWILWSLRNLTCTQMEMRRSASVPRTTNSKRRYMGAIPSPPQNKDTTLRNACCNGQAGQCSPPRGRIGCPPRRHHCPIQAGPCHWRPTRTAAERTVRSIVRLTVYDGCLSAEHQSRGNAAGHAEPSIAAGMV